MCCFRIVRVKSLQRAIYVVFSDNKTSIPTLGTFSLYITMKFEVLIFFPVTEKCTPHLLTPYANSFFFLFLSLFLFYWPLFVVEMDKNLKNNAYSIQKLWMGGWRCQLYVHYMFWCNQKHWEYVVLRCKEKKSIHIWYSCTDRKSVV